MKLSRLVLMAATAAGASLGMSASGAAEPADDVISFNRDIRPILSNNCYVCHGPDEGTRGAGMRLDLRDEALAGRSGSAAIVPGDPDASLIIERMEAHDPLDQMPPPDSQKSVTEEQIALLRDWIAEGAVYEAHWSYEPLERPEIPDRAPEGFEEWAKNPVDRFVLGRLADRGFIPAPEADRVTLIRRLSFDLTGLPPTPAEVDRFLNDRSPNAYEKLVDRLLASPHYGERMAVDWLDQVRYADTNGFHGDQHRNIWPYRDYVIRSFNENKPFDQFTIEQIAGDLLPNATTEQHVASGYNRLNQITAEGGAQAGEYLAMYAADRVRTTSTVWMASTFGCAECHDHKYDPVSIREFYEFAAFFADIEEQGVYSSRGTWDPELPLPSEDQEAEMARLQGDIERLEAALHEPTDALIRGQEAWERDLRRQLALGDDGWNLAVPDSYDSREGQTLTLLEDRSILTDGPIPDTDTYEVSFRPGMGSVTGLRLEAFPDPGFPKGLARHSGNFILTHVEVLRDGEPVPLAFTKATFEQKDWPARGTLDRSPNTGWAVAGHEYTETRSALYRFARPVETAPDTVLTVRLHHGNTNHPKHLMGRFRLAVTSANRPAFAPKEELPDAVFAALRVYTALRSPEEREALAAYYRSIAPELDEARRSLADARTALETLKNDIPTTLVTVSVEPRTMRVLPRGDWMDDSGPVVEPATPAFLPPLETENDRATRLDLARWLVTDEHPLTSRVTVNRLWKNFYGMGLSKVLDDLGLQGEWPSHPALLDWLAAEFRDSGWDMKRLVRLMVTSNTYRQDSNLREDLKEKDPFNRLLARQSRFRLEAEFVRDNALAVSGLLVPAIGGRSVKPYQPEGYWDNANTFTGPLIYDTDEGDNQYRRGLYTYWKRSFLHPSLMAFDAPSREECVAERVVSNTPLQALALLNDPSYVEAARVLAERMWREGGHRVSDRIEWAYRQVLSRTPDPAETIALAELYSRHRAAFQENPSDAGELVSTGLAPVPEDIPVYELAAWTNVARALLNLHEAITRA